MTVPFTFSAIDFETTGSVAGYPVDPWQVGVVVCTSDAEPLFWESLLQVGPRPFHPKAPGRHAQLRSELAQAPRMEECLSPFRQLCQNRPLVAHNCATEKKCLRESLPMERFGPWIDTLKLSRAAWPTLSSYKLEDVLCALGLLPRMQAQFPDRMAHDALYDAYGSALILEYLLAQEAWQGVSLRLLENPDQRLWRNRK
ncbi:3'-5' exonuclease [Kiritimatiellota bacterium B12222]|nr:3'-5' exonuclease [Kiritimatiellota bacterium B12222]